MKDWCDDLRRHVEEWSEKLKKSGRGWWPRYVYHFTDVTNARAILNSGELLSRAQVLAGPGMENDNANPEVISQTVPDHLELVRLFFRPRTPTQYHVEGIKRRHRRSTGHCPMPVFFLFDLVDLICRDDAMFSRGTMASARHGYSNRRSYFRSIDFEDVYHDEGLGIIETVRKREIIQARQAEVLVRDRLPLGDELRAIYCRSEAERATLSSGLNEGAAGRWGQLIRTGFDGLFFRFYPYVRQVSGSSGNLVSVEFSKSSYQELELEFTFDADSGNHYSSDSPLAPRVDKKRYRLPRAEAAGYATLLVEGCLAFEGRIVLDELPF